ncbi:hypothetical protein W97_05076 [Coniosporium apollinis CBS 100218]|uniref:Uncharacterized protein n=1 Tax=Coniosporium apollinis (strain CBS 100218) TaxID=1168221 RepID=R7YVJ3_CONA1|nr:uncharacterized protein W97_05076 [Coniosporium apollinis CBS 100218]EON65834.1 hypothetical protein W97_05076 [Coniosporium apollinis CBS 100218]
MNNQPTPSAGDDNINAHPLSHDTESQPTPRAPRTAPRYQAEQPDDLLIIGTDNAPEPRKKAVSVGAHRKRISKSTAVSPAATFPNDPSAQDLDDSNLAATPTRKATFGNFLTVPKLPKRRSSRALKKEVSPGITDVRGTPQIAGGSFISPHVPRNIQDVRGIPQIEGGSFIAVSQQPVQSGPNEGREVDGEETEADDEDEDEEGGVALPTEKAGDEE